MHQSPIVPDQQVTNLPFVADVKSRIIRMDEQLVYQCLALIRRHIKDVLDPGTNSIRDKEAFAPSFRMGAH